MTAKNIGGFAAMLMLAALFLWAAPARAAFGIVGYGESLSSAGKFDRQAGGHPDFVTRLQVNEIGFRTVIVDLPPGVLANPTATPTCPPGQIAAGEGGNSARCPIASQVGYVQTFQEGGQPGVFAAVYNMQHPADHPAQFAFNIAGVITKVQPTVRSTDFGITADTESISQGLSIDGVELRLWGVPADPSHDPERINPVTFMSGVSTDAEPKPFMIAPTSCDAPASFALKTDSWWEPGAFQVGEVAADASGTPFQFEGCGRLRFEPSAQVIPDSKVAGSPVGLDFTLTIPQNEAPYGISSSDLRRAVVRFPSGVSVSPSVAGNLGACGLAEIAIGSDNEPTCPASSRIGSVRVESPLLDEPLGGEVFLARQDENPFHSLLALYLVIRGPGILIKLPGRVDRDPSSGRLTVTFDETPQLPFETLSVDLEGGSKATLVSPSACGTYTTQAELTSWSSSTPVQVSAPMTIDQGCATRGFSPGLKAGSANPTGGSFSPFTLQVTRQDGEPNLSRIAAALPPGLLAKLAGVPLCGDAQAAAGTCSAASQVGTTTIGAGPGPDPLYLPEAGKAPTAVYLGGPYKGAPYSLVVKVPAQAGPFDLGTVVVRNALRIDPVTTQVTTESDPLPQILQGIPISYRDVRVEINRPGFTLNPTNCSQFQVAGTLTSASGQTASPKAPFAAANCEALGLQPKLGIRFSGAPTRRGGHPKLTATLTTRAGDANLQRVQVTLPKTEYLDNAHIKTVCTRVQYAADQCPAKSIYGYAKAWTPLLDKPLEGPVYLRSSSHTLPDLVASLNGGIHVDLDGRIDSVHKRIRNTFETVPDAPVSKFVLTLQGGGKGLLVNNTQLCKAKPKANVTFDGQNGKTAETNPLVKVGGCGKGRRKPKPKK